MSLFETVVDSVYTHIVKYKNSVESIKQFSDTLWVVASEDSNPMKMIFNKDYSLTISIGGSVKKGSYEILSVANNIILNIDGESKMYSHITTAEGLIYLQLDNSNAKPFILIDSILLQGKSSIEYLYNRFEKPKQIEDRVSNLDLKIRKIIFINEFSRIKICESNDNKFYAIQNRDFMSDGVYNYETNPKISIEIINNGEIKDIYRDEKLVLKDGRIIHIHHLVFDNNKFYTRAYDSDGPLKDGDYRINIFRKIRIKDGKVI